jgi:hypothetical protein
MNMINWAQLICAIKTRLWKNQVKSYREDAFRQIEAWENWVMYVGCLEQANNADGTKGCWNCNPSDYGLDFCPWKNVVKEVIE